MFVLYTWPDSKVVQTIEWPIEVSPWETIEVYNEDYLNLLDAFPWEFESTDWAGGWSATQWKTVRVDATNWDDGTAVKYDPSLPYATITAAKNAAVAGDLVRVRAWNYSDSRIQKNLVDFYFEPGCTVETVNIPIFDDQWEDDITCRIWNYGKILAWDNSNPWNGTPAMKRGYSNWNRSRVYIEQWEGLEGWLIDSASIFWDSSSPDTGCIVTVNWGYFNGFRQVYSAGKCRIKNSYILNSYIWTFFAPRFAHLEVRNCYVIRDAAFKNTVARVNSASSWLERSWEVFNTPGNWSTFIVDSCIMEITFTVASYAKWTVFARRTSDNTQVLYQIDNNTIYDVNSTTATDYVIQSGWPWVPWDIPFFSVDWNKLQTVPSPECSNSGSNTVNTNLFFTWLRLN